MKSAVVVDCVRTPIGRSHRDKGWFRDIRSDDLAVACVQALVERTGIDPQAIEDVLLGNTNQTLEQGMNVGRTVGLMAGVGVGAGGATINRLCGSSLQALNPCSWESPKLRSILKVLFPPLHFKKPPKCCPRPASREKKTG